MAGMSRGVEVPRADSAALREMVRRLVEVYAPVRIYLFGSVARGEATADSDYDLMVLVPDEAVGERVNNRAGFRSVRGIGTPRDIFVMREGEFSRQLHLRASFPATVVRDGIWIDLLS
ncbi:MAG TPA: nucleotidyltransferase domain-containing protein [Bryobacteraceae bacterium]|nr:nucleotidyltransferase domain-containing protein [Bryobacteraceae bacterium]